MKHFRAAPRSEMRAKDWSRFSILLRLLRDGAGVSPTFSEIAVAWGLSPASKAVVSERLDMFEAEGLIGRTPGRHRAISVVPYLVPARDRAGNMVVAGTLS